MTLHEDQTKGESLPCQLGIVEDLTLERFHPSTLPTIDPGDSKRLCRLDHDGTSRACCEQVFLSLSQRSAPSGVARKLGSWIVPRVIRMHHYRPNRMTLRRLTPFSTNVKPALARDKKDRHLAQRPGCRMSGLVPGGNYNRSRIQLR